MQRRQLRVNSLVTPILRAKSAAVRHVVMEDRNVAGSETKIGQCRLCPLSLRPPCCGDFALLTLLVFTMGFSVELHVSGRGQCWGGEGVDVL